MKKILLLFTLLLAAFSNDTAYSQKSDTTIQDALDFIKTNLNQSNNTANGDVSNSFYDFFSGESSSYMNYSYSEQSTYTVISAKSCIIEILETVSGNTKISYSEDDGNPDDSRIYSNFEYLKQDTITIDFSKISKIESRNSSIKFNSYNNIDFIKHSGLITQTPPKKRTNDLIRYFKSEEEDLYKKLKKFLVKNNINYSVSPYKTEHFDFAADKFILSITDRERCKRLFNAFDFLQKNCGVPKEKF